MDIFKIVGLGIISAVLCVFIKNTRPEFSVVISLAAAIILLFYILPFLKQVFSALSSISELIGIDSAYTTPVFKVIGIAYITQIGGDLCKDAGETAIATKIELAGKIAIVAIALPIAYKMISIINGIVFSV